MPPLLEIRRGQALVHAPHFLDTPHRDVEHVHALVAQLAVAVVPEETPVVVKAVGVEGPEWGGPEPHVVVGPRGRCAVGRGADAFTQLSDPGLDQADLAQFPGGRVFDSVPDVGGAAPLRADLDNAFVAARDIAHSLAFLDGLRQGLFDVDVLARLARQDHLGGVPVVWRGDDHRVDVLVFEHAAEVLAGRGFFPLRLLDIGADPAQDRVVDVAESLYLGPVLYGVECVGPALVAAADQAEHDLLVGAPRPGIQVGECGSRAGGRHSGILDKGPTILAHGPLLVMTSPLNNFAAPPRCQAGK